MARAPVAEAAASEAVDGDVATATVATSEGAVIGNVKVSGCW